ncbi:LysM peptidoglycan-binding domain-containing C40 family peptidase [Streptomyces coeruleoprunus]|uniref:LysM peptidoglycan-binding domain-containing C40 family peptidase n=1 Tax=Streptomyces coeruleoprunus TaxID=285563 RepID=A0ABV9XKW8_9ACTN
MFRHVWPGAWRARGVHRAPRPGAWWQRPAVAGVAMAAVRTTAVSLLALMAVVLGAVLAVHGPTSAAPAAPEASAPKASAPKRPGATPVSAPPAQGGRPVEKPVRPGKPAKPTRTLVLVPGDTLSELALRHRTTVRELQRLNGLGTSTLIYAGDTLRLPPGVTPKPSPRPAPAPPPATGNGAAKAVAYAKAQLGKPYVWGGTGPRGYDCSGLVMRAWQAAGVSLPRTTWDQIRSGRATSRSRLVPGDLVLTAGGGHIQLYIGDGKVIHAPRTGTVIQVAPLPAHSKVVAYRHIRG